MKHTKLSKEKFFCFFCVAFLFLLLLLILLLTFCFVLCCNTIISSHCMGKSVENSKESKCNTDNGRHAAKKKKPRKKRKTGKRNSTKEKQEISVIKKNIVRNTRSKKREIKTSTLSMMMQNENAKDHRTGSEAMENKKSNQEEKEEKKDGDIKNVFNVEIVKETTNSITLEWNLIPETDMYAIELHHKVKGWQMVEGTTVCYASVNQLEENFGYQFRVKALKLDSSAGQYITLHTSPAAVGITLPPEPTTICLFRAIKNDQQFLVKRILRRRLSLIEYPGPNGYLPLANAIAFSQMCIVDFILSSGANVNVGNPNNNRTPLHVSLTEIRRLMYITCVMRALILGE